ncbi:hypothetical protein ACJJTC_009687 [Scirpophaga incertulas]
MEQFIEAVRKYPCLWNTTAIEYRDQELKDAAWAEVMKETDLSSVKEVKMKWKKLRDSYRDALKRQSDMLAKEPGAAPRKTYPWKYMGQMQFLQPYMNARKKPQEVPPTPGNGHLPDRSSSESESDEEDTATAAADVSPKRKSDTLAAIDRKLDYLCRASNKRVCNTNTTQALRREPPAPDPLDIFFNSMCQSTKRFPFPTQIKIKRRLFEAVIEAEEALVAEQQNYAGLWARAASSSSEEDADEPS